jgi:hypothetical protein
MGTKINCECEHASHFVDDPMPPGGYRHTYGDLRPTGDVETEYGVFALCSDCRELGHMTTAVINKAWRCGLCGLVEPMPGAADAILRHIQKDHAREFSAGAWSMTSIK